MLLRFSIAIAALLTVKPAEAGEKADVADTYTWLSKTEDVQVEGILWNDRFGDGKDRYKTGGMTQSWLLPETIFSDEPWIEGHASALELQGRGFIITPDNTTNPAAGDRPFAQYVGVGAYLRTVERPEALTPSTTLSVEHRMGVELGLLGDPLPLFDIQDAVHETIGPGGVGRTSANTLDTEVLANLEAKRTYRFHTDLEDTEVELAPFGQLSLGMRENAARLGGDVIWGSSLKARTWNHDPAIGALIPGGPQPRPGFQWLGCNYPPPPCAEGSGMIHGWDES